MKTETKTEDFKPFETKLSISKDIIKELKEEIKTEIKEEFLNKLSIKVEQCCNAINIEKFDPTMVYQINVEFKDYVTRDIIYRYCQGLSKLYKDAGLKAIVVPRCASNAISDIKIEEVPNE